MTAEPCGSCSRSQFPSLCCHKSTAKAASLCVFDTRAGVSMVQRYSMHHRSLFPRMACARSNYLFTSHVGAPLAVWDKRWASKAAYMHEIMSGASLQTALHVKLSVTAHAKPLALLDRGALVDRGGGGGGGGGQQARGWGGGKPTNLCQLCK